MAIERLRNPEIPLKSKISLIGYRGTGKSTIADGLMKQLGRYMISTDSEAVRRSGLSIPTFVERFGWDEFRRLESEICKDLADVTGVIIDTGGGIVLNPENIENLKRGGVAIWLTADIPTIVSRIGGDNNRPSLTGKTITEEVEEVLSFRLPMYKEAADYTFSTQTNTVEDVLRNITDLIIPSHTSLK